MDAKPELGDLDSAQLYQYRNELVEALSAVNMQVAERRTQGRLHVKAGQQDWQNVGPWIGTLKTQMRWKPLVMPELGFPVHNFYSFMIEIPPGTEEGRYHIHGEAIKLYLKGRGVELIGDERFEVEAGDVVLVPANVWHGTQNPYDEPVHVYGVQQMNGSYLQAPVLISNQPPEE